MIDEDEKWEEDFLTKQSEDALNNYQADKCRHIRESLAQIKWARKLAIEKIKQPGLIQSYVVGLLQLETLDRDTDESKNILSDMDKSWKKMTVESRDIVEKISKKVQQDKNEKPTPKYK